MLVDLYPSHQSHRFITEFQATIGVSLSLNFSAAGNVLTVSFTVKNILNTLRVREPEIQLCRSTCRKLSNCGDVFYERFFFNLMSNIITKVRVDGRVKFVCIKLVLYAAIPVLIVSLKTLKCTLKVLKKSVNSRFENDKYGLRWECRASDVELS